jgi:hypothetical protein
MLAQAARNLIEVRARFVEARDAAQVFNRESWPCAW